MWATGQLPVRVHKSVPLSFRTEGEFVVIDVATSVAPPSWVFPWTFTKDGYAGNAREGQLHAEQWNMTSVAKALPDLSPM